MKQVMERFDRIIFGDFEYRSTSGNLPEIRCGVFVEYPSNEVQKFWSNELPRKSFIQKNDLFVAYYAPAEISCFQQLGWDIPNHIIDLFAEHRVSTNGLSGKASLLDALKIWKLASIDATEKDEMRALALREGDDYSEQEKIDLLDYCFEDTKALTLLFEKLLPFIDIDQALYRGDYMKTISTMERHGIAIDTHMYKRIKENEENLKNRLISKVDNQYGVFDGTVFKRKLFENYLIDNNIPWPKLASGNLSLKEETFSEQSKIYPKLHPLHQTLQFKKKATVEKLAVGKDGRNRTMLSPFRSKTGRNQPSGNKFVFNCPSWVRGLVKPGEGSAIAYIDWSQQEVAIAADLSSDPKMIDAYESGDPYLAFGKQAGLIPIAATKESHKEEREQCKACVLAMQYGMGEDTFSRYIKRPKRTARMLIEMHKKTFSQFWTWSDSVVDFARQKGFLKTSLGWSIHIDAKTSTNSIRNFMMQAHGAEILRLACILICEQDIKLCAPVHDAVLIESPMDQIDDDIEVARQCMEDAGSVVLSNVRLRTDYEKIEYPNRYMDPRGEFMWGQVMEALSEIEDVHEQAGPVHQ